MFSIVFFTLVNFYFKQFNKSGFIIYLFLFFSPLPTSIAHNPPVTSLNLLENCDLNIFVTRSTDGVISVPPFFTQIILHQYIHIPRHINVAVVKKTFPDGHSIAIPHLHGKYGYPSNAQSLSRCSVAFVDLGQLVQQFSSGFILSYDLMGLIISHAQPHYVFAHVDSPNWFYHIYYYMHSGLAKLVLWNTTTLSKVYIPCVLCQENTPSLDNIKSLGDLDSKWNNVNRNLHQKIIWNEAFLARVDINSNINSKFVCGPNLPWFHYGDESSCTMSVFQTKYNASLRRRASDNIANFGPSLAAIFNMKVLSNPAQLQKGTAHKHYVFRVEFENLKYAIVTKLPSPMGNFSALFSPFDDWTWFCLLSSLILVTTGVQLQFYFKGQVTNNLTNSVLNLGSLLLNQPCGAGIYESCRTTVVPLLGGWAFICFIVMNNLYGGEVFSSLAVTLAPRLPKTTQELAQSSLPIFTKSFFTNRGQTTKVSILIDTIIPQLEKVFGKAKDEKYLKFLAQIKRKLIFPPAVDFNKKPSPSWDYPIPLINNSLTANATFAILDTSTTLDSLLATAPSFRKRFLIQSKEPWSPFTLHKWAEGRKNYFSPQIYLTLGQLKESGITQRWKKEFGLRGQVFIVRTHWKERSPSFIAQKMFHCKKPMFNEFEPVPFQVVEYIWVLFLTALLVGVALFVWEVLYNKWTNCNVKCINSIALNKICSTNVTAKTPTLIVVNEE